MQPTFVAYPYGGKGTEIMGVTWAQAALAFVLMALRTYTNTSIVRSFKWDYFWAMLTLVDRPSLGKPQRPSLLNLGVWPGSSSHADGCLRLRTG